MDVIGVYTFDWRLTMICRKLISLCLVMIILAVGCRTGITDTPVLTQTPTAVTNMPLPITENTPVSTIQATPVTPTPQQPTVTPTPTQIPILPVEAAQNRVVELLADNGDCRLPCLWGITPGLNNNQFAEEILVPLSSISDFVAFTPDVGNITFDIPIGEMRIHINVDFLITIDVITRLSFQARALEYFKNEQDFGSRSVFNSDAFGEHLHLFMLPQILNEYGVPESVYVFTFPEEPPARYGSETFQITLLYPDQGILVEYTTQLRVEGENVLGCFSNAHVEMELTPIGDRDLFFEHIVPSWQGVIDHDKPLEEATSMTLEEFYETFRQHSDQCLETPSEIWPTAEN
ncbi:MAG: hypothetical protein EHM70_17710 [Chloroflexota bacterium]|nr:MAG: hypothetical protein EHM70_17710 [Chloroflexota bacterium]